MAQTTPELRIGTSGYQYDHWKQRFYPEDLPKKQWFGWYADRFDTVEINNTFYHLPKVDTFKAWHDQTPPGFRYAVKFSRYGSHIKKLKDPEGPIQQFVDGVAHLGAYLGPILVQLPPRWHVNVERLERFLAAAPRDQRWAVELRDPSWLCDEVYAVLRAHNAALCLHDMLPDHPREITADWVYLRYHGDHYQGSYSHQFLAAEARRIKEYLRDHMDVYAYFNNDQNAYSVFNALDLRRDVLNE